MMGGCAVVKSIKYVYVAGPYISHPHHNTARAISYGNQLVDLGFVPIIPHIMSAVWNIHTPRDEEFWLGYTMDIMLLCDAVLRFPGESSGADRETARAEQMGIPVFNSVEDLPKAPPICLNCRHRDGGVCYNCDGENEGWATEVSPGGWCKNHISIMPIDPVTNCMI